MHVALIAYTPDPEKTVASAARLCYSPCGVEDIRKKMDGQSVAGFIQMLRRMGHESPFEHASFTFGIEGISRSMMAQITRHRMASFSVQSQRYVPMHHFEYIMPPEIAGIPEAEREFKIAMDACLTHYQNLSEILQRAHMGKLREEGVSEEEAAAKAEKTAIEDARFVLPNACATKLVVTMNARSLFNFFAQRCCNRAQWEIRAVAKEMLRLVKQVAPAIFAFAGPDCVSDRCHEGKMSCNRAAEMRELYGRLGDEN